MKLIGLVLLVLLIWLQYKIWLQDGGIPEVLQLEQEVEALNEKVSELLERNASLDAEVRDLKKGLDAIEERARSEMGMIREGEVYYQVVERKDKAPDEAVKPEAGNAPVPPPQREAASDADKAGPGAEADNLIRR